MTSEGYSGAFLELADGPVILTAPDIADRYWSVEVADAYTNNGLVLTARRRLSAGPDRAWSVRAGAAGFA